MAFPLCSCVGHLAARQCHTLPCDLQGGLGLTQRTQLAAAGEKCGAAAVIPAGLGISKAQSAAAPCYPPEHLELWALDMEDEICDIHAAVRSNSVQKSPLS